MTLRIQLIEYSTSPTLELNNYQLSALSDYRSLVDVLPGNVTGEYRIKAKSYVGTLLLPDLVISIQPKIGPVNFFRMFMGGDGKSLPKEITSLIGPSDSIWDLLATAFLSEVTKLVQMGLLRKYVEEESNLSYPLGQILFYQDFVTNTPVRKGMYCKRDYFTENIFENQALKWGVETLIHLVSSSTVMERLVGYSRWFSEIEFLGYIPKVSLPEQNHPYYTALYFVDLLTRFIPVGGHSDGMFGQAYYFNMVEVFEAFVRQQLRNRLEQYGICVAYKGEKDKTLCTGVGLLKPDLILISRRTSMPIAIGDCKYKQDWNKPNDDIYQMLAYLEGYSPIEYALVFYPTTKTEVFFDKVVVPRNRSIVSIGIPEQSLLSEDTWKIVIQRVIGLDIVDMNLKAILNSAIALKSSQ